MNTIQYCAPADARGSESEPQFSSRQQNPVETHFEADGEAVSRTGIAFGDYERMQTFKRALVHRRRGIPEWALDPAKVRAVLVAYFEARAFGPKERARSQNGTEVERLERACERLRANAPRKLAVMDSLCAEYVALKQAGGDPAQLKTLVAEIEGLDTFLRLTAENAPAIILGVIYQSYNVGMDSVGVGAMFGIKPPHVRQLLWRLNQTYKRMATPLSSRG